MCVYLLCQVCDVVVCNSHVLPISKTSTKNSKNSIENISLFRFSFSFLSNIFSSLIHNAHVRSAFQQSHTTYHITTFTTSKHDRFPLDTFDSHVFHQNIFHFVLFPDNLLFSGLCSVLCLKICAEIGTKPGPKYFSLETNNIILQHT